MRRRIELAVLVTAVFATAVALAPPPAATQSFWQGGDITEYITEEQAAELNSLIASMLPQVLGGFMGPAATNNPEGAVGMTIWEHGETWDGYTLLSLPQGSHEIDPETGASYGALLVDMDGTLVHKWPITGFPAKMLPDGTVMGGFGRFEELIGVPSLVRMDWNHNILWQWDGDPADAWPFLGPNPPPPFQDMNKSGYHHDFQFPGSPVGYYHPGIGKRHHGRGYHGHGKTHGKTLILSNYVTTLDQTCPTGNPDDPTCLSTMRLYDDAIYEVDRDGNTLWKWFAWEHFAEMGFRPDELAHIKYGFIGFPNALMATDYQHINNANYIGPNKWYYKYKDLRFHPDNIIWDSRSTNIIAIIARHDHPRGKWQQGDIIWKLGPDYSVDQPAHSVGQMIGPHHAHVIPAGLPGAGNVLVFDNGGMAGLSALIEGLPPNLNPPWGVYRNYSRVVEFNPRTLQIVWQYVQRERRPNLNGPDAEVYEPDTSHPRKFFAAVISGAQRLPNGNTLICEGTQARIFEVNKKGKIVWEYISPYFGNNFGGPLAGNMVYRAYRVPKWWVDPHLYGWRR
jgi:hypothetical protein